MISPLTVPITDDEIRIALFSILDDKATGSDGFTSLFFKRAWDIIDTDFRDAMRHFFATNEMPKCVNATRIALVPKVESSSRMMDFRPISCCNVLYKCISQVIVNRFKVVFSDIIGVSHWDFILLGLCTVGFPERMVRWIMTCICTPYFSVALNEELHGFFRSSRGVQQGDPLSPYLFVLAMEGWAAITHLCFADDLMVLYRADTSFVRLIKSALDYFATVYWSSMFLLPVATIRQIESNLASFLLEGYFFVPFWCQGCMVFYLLSISGGWPGIKRIEDWNRAAILKYVWRLLTDRSSIWSSWARLVLLRGRSFWHIRVTFGASWAWRKILLSRGPLCDLLPFRTLASTSLPQDARVSNIIRDGLWGFPSGSVELQYIWDSITMQPLASHPHHLVWKGHPSGRFSIDLAWNVLEDKRDVNLIHHLLWLPGSASETHDHLFFSCDFSSYVWQEVTTWTLSTWPTLSWFPLFQWASLHLRRKGDFSHLLSWLVLLATVYFLWFERNNSVFRRHCSSRRDIVLAISDLVWAKILALAPKYEMLTQLHAIWHLPD
ncbi:uncharacterized protein LOC116107604 [Pistacia vera]|uniref:uncharacterized protein LOC116107604 n=1 Tax=Pistacia vera TaxID=55513 RepID=UPI001263D038|nr:uncharacterized protein LOC116107604 [Pistacia vera]